MTQRLDISVTREAITLKGPAPIRHSSHHSSVDHTSHAALHILRPCLQLAINLCYILKKLWPFILYCIVSVIWKFDFYTVGIHQHFGAQDFTL